MKIIAHRGYHAAGHPENSFGAFVAASKLEGLYAAETDVWVTMDDVLLLHHDGVLDGRRIETSTHEQLLDLKLANGEGLPRLESLLSLAAGTPGMRLIIEIKIHEDAARGDHAVDLTMQMVEKYGLRERVEYISFGLELCRRILHHDARAHVSYVSGDIAPTLLEPEGIRGIDYKFAKLLAREYWINEARELGMSVNAWTLNADEDIRKAIALGLDYITTDEPVRVMELLREARQGAC